MAQVVLDADLKARLKGLDEETEFCEADGRTLGHFLPNGLYQELLYSWARKQFDDDELNRARQEPGGMTTAQAIAHVRSVAGTRRGK